MRCFRRLVPFFIKTNYPFLKKSVFASTRPSIKFTEFDPRPRPPPRRKWFLFYGVLAAINAVPLAAIYFYYFGSRKPNLPPTKVIVVCSIIFSFPEFMARRHHVPIFLNILNPNLSKI